MLTGLTSQLLVLAILKQVIRERDCASYYKQANDTCISHLEEGKLYTFTGDKYITI